MANEPTVADRQSLQTQAASELNDVFENILPWTLATQDQAQWLTSHTEQNQESLLLFMKSLYLFKLIELSVSDDSMEESVSKAIGKRHQALITAAYQANFTLATVLVGRGGGSVELYLGVSGLSDHTKDIFFDQVRGIYPGKGIELKSGADDADLLHSALTGKTNGGVITGIPPMRLENERQFFNLTSVVRSMYGRPFVLMSVARPVPRERAAGQILDIMGIKDRCHLLVNQTIMRSQTVEKHEDTSTAKSTTIGGGNNASTTNGMFGSGAGTAGVNLSGAVSITTGVSLPYVATVTVTGTIGGTLSGTLTLGLSKSKTKGGDQTRSETLTESQSSGWSKSIGESLQLEQQNSLAMELELIADKLIKRLRIGLNSGIWEYFLTYATPDETASKILSGALCGELLKADPDALPSRNISAQLPAQGFIFLPTTNKDSTLLKGNPLVSYVSSEEAALLLSPPLNAIPGFDIRVKPALSLTDTCEVAAAIGLGTISEHGRSINGSRFALAETDLRKHVFVAGLTGSGKTTTVKQILAGIDVPFLVLESAKREYRRLLSDIAFRNPITVYTVGDSAVSPFRHNPFWIIPGVSVLTHIDHLKSIFNASFSLYGPMPYLLEQCLHNIYRQRGWNMTTGAHHAVKIANIDDSRLYTHIYPCIRDLITEVNRVVQSAGYAGELKDNIRSAIVARLESLAVGAKGFIFNTAECTDIGQLLDQRVVFELESLADDDDKAFFVGLILSLISEYRQAVARNISDDSADRLRHILVIEEAHRLLKNISTERSSELMGNPKGKAVETFCNIVAEMRSLGQGVIVAEQIPTKIAPDVLKNTNTKIIHRLVSSDDQKTVGASLGLPEADVHYLNQLSTGFALAHKEGMARPVEVCISNTLSNRPVSDDQVRDKMYRLRPTDQRAQSMRRLPLDKQLELHESNLLDDPATQDISRRLINSIFLAEMELKDLIPRAISHVRQRCRCEYLSDDTVQHALERSFSRILLSPTYELGGQGHPPNEAVLEALHRFWHEQSQFNRARLIRTLDQWCGASCVDRVREMAAASVILQIAADEGQSELQNALNRELLVKDTQAVDRIRNSIKEKVL